MYNNDNYDGPIFQNKNQNNNQENNSKNFFSQDQFVTPQNNYDYNNINNYDRNNNQIYNNNFLNSKDQAHNYNNVFNGNVQNMDIPPELDQIQNLSDAKKIDGPTLSALDPMNVMPSNVETNMNKLELYDNGINSFNQSYNENENVQNFNTSNNNQDYMVNNSSNFDSNIPENNIYQNSNSINDYNALNHDDQSLNNNYYNSYNGDVNKPLDENNIFNPNNSFNVDMNNLPDLENDNNNYSNNYSYDPSSANSNTVLSLDEYLKSGNNTTEEQDNSSIENENSYNLGINNIPDLSSFILPQKNEEIKEEKEDSYNLVQDISLSQPKINKIDDIEDINNMYNEPDTLEIMDLESDQETENVNIESVDKIKELITKLKNSGEKIEIEEFDFEDTYQLIIKIAKEKSEK